MKKQPQASQDAEQESHDTASKTPTAKSAGKAGTGGLLGVGVVWAANRGFDLNLSAEAGAGIASAITTVALFVWRFGLLNILNQLLHGDGEHGLLARLGNR